MMTLIMSKSKTQHHRYHFQFVWFVLPRHVFRHYEIHVTEPLFLNKGMVGIDDLIHVKIPNQILIAIIFNFDTF
jgi:hypothetical protein